MQCTKINPYVDNREYVKWYPRIHVFYTSPLMWWRRRKIILHAQVYLMFLTLHTRGCKIALVGKGSNLNIFPKLKIFELLLWRFCGEYNG